MVTSRTASTSSDVVEVFFVAIQHLLVDKLLRLTPPTVSA